MLILEKHDEIFETIDPRDNNPVKAKAIFEVIRDANFWNDITLLARILEPLAVTALTLQANNTRLDHVLLSLGKLYTQFEAWLGKSPSDHERESNIAVMKSLERRWAEADQDLFITAVILNVFVGRTRLCFATGIQAWKHHGLFKTIQRVYSRLFGKNPPASILEEFRDYQTSKGQFSDEALLIQEHRELASSNMG